MAPWVGTDWNMRSGKTKTMSSQRSLWGRKFSSYNSGSIHRCWMGEGDGEEGQGGRENEQTQKAHQPVIGQVYLECVSKRKHFNQHPFFISQFIYILHFLHKNGLKNKSNIISLINGKKPNANGLHYHSLTNAARYQCQRLNEKRSH